MTSADKNAGLKMRIKALQPIDVTPPNTPPLRSTLDGGGGAAAAAAMVEEQPLSPTARLLHSPRLNCCIIAIMGSKTEINVDVVKDGLMNSFAKHLRMSSKLVMNDKKGEEPRWVQTNVNLENHVIVPELDPNMDSSDQFVEDYVSNLTTIPMDISKPLWELHLLNIKTSHARAVGVFKIHHSLGDGSSLISLLLACTRKSSDPEALPSLPTMKKSTSSSTNGFWQYLIAFWLLLKLVSNTLIHVMLFSATTLFLKDTKTPIKGDPGIKRTPKRIVHRTVSLNDIKLVKSEMNMTINDVMLGVTQAGLSHYLNRRYGNAIGGNQETAQRDNLPKNIRLRATVMVNTRPSGGIQELADMMAKGSKCKWGNVIGYILLPLHIAVLDDPLDYLREAKATIDPKKLSLEAKASHYISKLMADTFGTEAAAALTYRVLSNVTLCFSNVAGPVEEISFYGHPIAYVAPAVHGLPQALTVIFQSHADKMTIVVAVDQDVIPDPHRLCDDLEESLQLIKNAVVDRRSSEV
ncbi:hypothetical protein Ancab_009089 [Ancistrocladus abbreviatus]